MAIPSNAIPRDVTPSEGEDHPDAGAPVSDMVEDPEYLLEEGRSEETPPPEKREKTYPMIAPAAKRKGLTPVLTTLFNVHEREAITIFKGRRVPEELAQEIFRCRGFAKKVSLDPRLVEAVLDAAEHFESPRVNIISAYRSPKFNDALAKKGRRVAAESKHTKGQAIDFSLVTVRAQELGAWLWESFDGGVGTYRNDNFVHIDVGRKRQWRGK